MVPTGDAGMGKAGASIFPSYDYGATMSADHSPDLLRTDVSSCDRRRQPPAREGGLCQNLAPAASAMVPTGEAGAGAAEASILPTPSGRHGRAADAGRARSNGRMVMPDLPCAIRIDNLPAGLPLRSLWKRLAPFGVQRVWRAPWGGPATVICANG